jgi:hypothetical protein
MWDKEVMQRFTTLALVLAVRVPCAAGGVCVQMPQQVSCRADATFLSL